MADDAQSLRSINWRELFPFIHLFRAFRVAIHPSKLVLGFALLFLLYAGGRVFDGVWPAKYYAAPTELDSYTGFLWAHDHAVSFDEQRLAEREKNASEYAAALVESNIVKDQDKALDAANAGEYHAKLQQSIVQTRNDQLEQARIALKDRLGAIDNDKSLNEQKRKDAQREARIAFDASERNTQAQTIAAIAKLNSITPAGLFDTFFNYEIRQFHDAVDSALSWNWLAGITSGSDEPVITSGVITGRAVAGPGVVRSVANLAVVGPGWLLRYHLLYFVLFAAWFLLLWAIFGGAISRIAGVHVARDEKISVRQALRFSTSKLLSFIFAPIIPLIIILVAGAIIALGGLLWYLPVIGPIVGGAIFILALLAGFIITLVGVGTVGGFNLMYPTIAVEGSDSFDAISRSFSYIFARPWRMLFYTAVSLVYGALCFLFVRYFVYVMLGVTHFFASWFLAGQAAHYWPQIWPQVNDANLAYRINFQALSWGDGVSAFLIACWVYIVLAFLAAFVVSFYFSANTIIYYLMRREVDATELDDVYVEDADEDFAEVAVAATATTATAAPEPPAATATPTP